mgnify:CR=1 FL=1
MSWGFTESEVEDAALAWLDDLGYTILHGPEIAPGEPFAEREDYGQVVLAERLRQALYRLNPDVPPIAIDEAFRKLAVPESASLVGNNATLHRYLVEGVPVEYPHADGAFRGDLVRALDYDAPEANAFLAINQFTVVENKHTRRPDVVLFVNGLPLVLVELKNAADENATLWSAFHQLQTYKSELPALFAVRSAEGFAAGGVRLLAAGVTCWLAYDALLNIAVMTAIVPPTGVPLPFISFGGSSLVAALCGVGLMLSVSRASSQATVPRRRQMPEYPVVEPERRSGRADHDLSRGDRRRRIPRASRRRGTS